MEDLPVALGIANLAFLGMWCAERWGSFRLSGQELRAARLPEDNFEPVSMIHWVDGEKVHVLALPVGGTNPSSGHETNQADA